MKISRRAGVFLLVLGSILPSGGLLAQEFCPEEEKEAVKTSDMGQAAGQAPLLAINERTVITAGVPLGETLEVINNNNTAGIIAITGRTSGPRNVTGILGRVGGGAQHGNVGVRGSSSATGRTYGVEGEILFSNLNGSAGVRGVDASGPTCAAVDMFFPAGVRGDSKSHRGVLGVSEWEAVAGKLINAQGQIASEGVLGYTATVGVHAVGDITATGQKQFVEPHPGDPTKVIRYVSLEGPESGTYFRGSLRTVRGTATIEVPESFRLVTDGEGLTVQLTPIGAPASLYVVSQDLDRIVVQSSKDVRFHYLVQGVRRGYRDHEAISDGEEFRPESAEARMPLSFSKETRSRLIANRTYNEDGTVNMETARALGWAERWEERKKPRN